MSDSAESTRQFNATDTVRQEIEDVEDVNEATKRVNSILNELREDAGKADVQIVIADLADDDQPSKGEVPTKEDENWLYNGECPNCGDALCIERLGDSDICYDCGTEVDADA